MRAIVAKASGLDHIDISEVKRRGIRLGYTPIVLNDAVADIAVGLLIAAARRFHEGRLKIERNQWMCGSPRWMLGHDIRGSTVGIVGLGGIGQIIIKRLKGFDVAEFLYSGRSEKTEGSNAYALVIFIYYFF